MKHGTIVSPWCIQCPMSGDELWSIEGLATQDMEGTLRDKKIRYCNG